MTLDGRRVDGARRFMLVRRTVRITLGTDMLFYFIWTKTM
jgi:hypothetical protein